MLRFMFTAVEKRHGAGKLQQIVSAANCDLGVFVSDGDFNRWLEANVSLTRPPHQHESDLVLFQKFTSTVLHGTRGLGDVMMHIKQLLDQKKGADAIIDYINVSSSSLDPQTFEFHI